ncbi:hypothetical protein NliqN6_4140 [Naganishia liquefaciens]|uniref:Survival protein SurE-like phosphatase/nucleotidase domain-containing protein n=1 Tax=Naganishia liquefaciens TaxID=104408 RepID=A0A8H3TVM8_9TREE|nr:hypothetical protein NliqN6_4140 [Naganishia liquefaciens]
MSFGSKAPVVLLTNDDGPPSPSSPNIYSFAKALKSTLGWDVRVVVPDCQKSWVGSAYAISDVIEGKYFYPREPDGLEGEITTTSRPLKEGETMEWVLLSGTPATCANIALHNLYPDEIDLVISGPNHGRNSSSAFAISSGTIGATLGSSFSSYPSIALSYGVVQRPVPANAITLANEAAVTVVERLWADWGVDQSQQRSLDGSRMRGRVQLYAVNLLLVERFLERENRKVVWTRIARNGYGQLFKPKRPDSLGDTWHTGSVAAKKPSTEGAAQHAPPTSQTTGTNAPQKDSPDSTKPASAGPAVQQPVAQGGDQGMSSNDEQQEEDGRLVFHFAPDMKPLILPEEETLLEGTDSWALHHGYISVTPLQASYAEPDEESMCFGSEVGANRAPERNGEGKKGVWKL